MKNIKKTSRGGKREGAGRKRIGETRKISLSLPLETWQEIYAYGGTFAEYFRNLQAEIERLEKEVQIMKEVPKINDFEISTNPEPYDIEIEVPLIKEEKVNLPENIGIEELKELDSPKASNDFDFVASITSTILHKMEVQYPLEIRQFVIETVKNSLRPDRLESRIRNGHVEYRNPWNHRGKYFRNVKRLLQNEVPRLAEIEHRILQRKKAEQKKREEDEALKNIIEENKDTVSKWK